jgi:hypothetical protein
MISITRRNSFQIDGNEFAIIKKELEDNKDLWYSDYYYNLAMNRFLNARKSWVEKNYRMSLDLLKDLKYVCPADFDLTKIDLIVAILMNREDFQGRP